MYCNDDELKFLPIGFHVMKIDSHKVYRLFTYYSQYENYCEKIPSGCRISSVRTQIISFLNVCQTCRPVYSHTYACIAAEKISEKCEADTTNLHPTPQKKKKILQNI